MKFQNPSFKFFLNGRTNGRTNKQTDKPKAICSPLFQSWGHNKKMSCKLSHIMRKPFFFCICENKGADHLRSCRTEYQCLCFCYIDSTIPPLPKSEILSFYASSVVVQPVFCQTWSETPQTGFVVMRLNYSKIPILIRLVPLWRLTSGFLLVVAAACAINMDLMFAFGLVPGLMMLGFLDFFLSPSFFSREDFYNKSNEIK